MLFFFVLVNTLMVVHSARESCEWIAWTHTGTEDNSGTNDNVYIKIFGSGTSTIFHILDDVYRDDFENGHWDTFTFNSKCLTPDKVEMKIDGDDGWYLYKVELKRRDDPKTRYIFACSCWLDDGERRYINLLPTGQKATCIWTAVVWTGSQSHADTDDEVHIKIYGNGTSTTYHKLGGVFHYKLATGSKDTFYFSSKCLTPTRINIKIDGDNGWFVKKVELSRDFKGNYIFTCNCWVDNWERKYIDVN